MATISPEALHIASVAYEAADRAFLKAYKAAYDAADAAFAAAGGGDPIEISDVSLTAFYTTREAAISAAHETRLAAYIEINDKLYSIDNYISVEEENFDDFNARDDEERRAEVDALDVTNPV